MRFDTLTAGDGASQDVLLERQKLENLIENALRDEFAGRSGYDATSLAVADLAGVRTKYTIDWGDPNPSERLIKINPIEVTRPNGRRHFEAGYDSEYDGIISRQIPNAFENHILTPVDYGHVTVRGEDYAFIVEPKLQNARNLDELIEEHPKGLPKYIVKEIVHGIIKPMRHLHKHGFVYRDLQAGNILVTEDGSGEYGVWLTDRNNVGRVDETEAKPIPTAGSTTIQDPTIFGRWNGEPRAYDKESDVYAFGKLLARMLTGKHVNYSDWDENTLGDHRGRNLLHDGKLNATAHDHATTQFLMRHPLRTRGYWRVIKNTLKADERHHRPSFERIARFLGQEKLVERVMIGSMVGVIAIGSAAGYLIEQQPRTSVREFAGISNSLVDAQINIRADEKIPYLKDIANETFPVEVTIIPGRVHPVYELDDVPFRTRIFIPGTSVDTTIATGVDLTAESPQTNTHTIHMKDAAAGNYQLQYELLTPLQGSMPNVNESYLFDNQQILQTGQKDIAYQLADSLHRRFRVWRTHSKGGGRAPSLPPGANIDEHSPEDSLVFKVLGSDRQKLFTQGNSIVDFAGKLDPEDLEKGSHVVKIELYNSGQLIGQWYRPAEVDRLFSERWADNVSYMPDMMQRIKEAEQ